MVTIKRHPRLSDPDIGILHILISLSTALVKSGTLDEDILKSEVQDMLNHVKNHETEGMIATVETFYEFLTKGLHTLHVTDSDCKDS